MKACYTCASCTVHTNKILDIAFAATAIKTQDVHGSSFRYAKVMTLPFFGSGMVEIPPDGYKRMKNSRKMQMVFFVHEGKVTVDIEDVQFGMTKGGVWQVPRGEFFLFSFLSPSFHSSCLRFLFCILRRNSGQRCCLHRNNASAKISHTDLCFEVTLGTTCPCSVTDRCQSRVFTPGFLYHKQSETWGTAIRLDPWYWDTLKIAIPRVVACCCKQLVLRLLTRGICCCCVTILTAYHHHHTAMRHCLSDAKMEG
jgi:hypothetical protein